MCEYVNMYIPKIFTQVRFPLTLCFAAIIFEFIVKLCNKLGYLLSNNYLLNSIQTYFFSLFKFLLKIISGGICSEPTFGLTADATNQHMSFYFLKRHPFHKV